MPINYFRLRFMQRVCQKLWRVLRPRQQSCDGVFRRQTIDIKRSSLLPNKSEDIGSKDYVLLLAVLLLLLLVHLFWYFNIFWLQYQKLYMPPTFAVTTPVQESIVKEKKLDILGTTNPDATVIVNGISVTVRSDGIFYTDHC